MLKTRCPDKWCPTIAFIIVAILFYFIVGCCQQEGAYEECIHKGHNLCIDFYPKCEPCEELKINKE